MKYISPLLRRAMKYCALFVLPTLLLLSCQTPTETPPAELRTITVQVQNGRTEPLALVPVEMYDGGRGETADALLARGVTDQNGMVRFTRTIVTTGAHMLFVVGDQTSGKIRVSANLLCRDTILVIELATEELPCNGTFNYTMRLKACSPNLAGATFSDSTQILFRSSCDVVLSISRSTTTPIPDVRLSFVDGTGKEITDDPFLLPPRGSFTVRAKATPTDSGVFKQTTVLRATGPGADITINADLELTADNCNKCDCPKDTVIALFGLVQAAPEQKTKLLQITLPANSCQIVRRDEILKGPTSPEIFQIRSALLPEIKTNERQIIAVEFSPKELRGYRDTIIIQGNYEGEKNPCLFKVILTGEGCGPACRLVPDPDLVTASAPFTHAYAMSRARAYEGSSGRICLQNVGKCGVLRITGAFDNPTPGFSVSPNTLDIAAGATECFAIRFDARDDVVWPNGHGQTAKIDHNATLVVSNCSGINRVNVTVRVDTIPILFSRCVYQWNQNGMYGYNFTPVEGKGEDRFDPDYMTNQLSDIVADSVMVALGQAGVHVKNGWKLIRNGVTAAQFNFDDMSKSRNGWTRTQYLSITDEVGFTTSPLNTTFTLRSVYSIRIVRGSSVTYACIRVREISEDADGKRKICVDVLYPMINE